MRLLRLCQPRPIPQPLRLWLRCAMGSPMSSLILSDRQRGKQSQLRSNRQPAAGDAHKWPAAKPPPRNFAAPDLLVAATVVGMCFGGSGVLWYSFGDADHSPARGIRLVECRCQWLGHFRFDRQHHRAAYTVDRLVDRFGTSAPVVLIAIPLCALAIGLGSFVTGQIWTLYLVTVVNRDDRRGCEFAHLRPRH